MAIWYRNSILASILSITGCAFLCVAVSELFGEKDGDISSVVLAIAIGLVLAIAGNFVSKRKAQKQAQGKAARPEEGAQGQGPELW